MKAVDHERNPKLAVIPHIQDKTEQLSQADLQLKQRNLTLYNDVAPASKTEAFGRYELHHEIVQQRAKELANTSGTQRPISKQPAKPARASDAPPALADSGVAAESDPLEVAGLRRGLLGGGSWSKSFSRKVAVSCVLLGAFGGWLLWLARSHDEARKSDVLRGTSEASPHTASAAPTLGNPAKAAPIPTSLNAPSTLPEGSKSSDTKSGVERVEAQSTSQPAPRGKALSTELASQRRASARSSTEPATAKLPAIELDAARSKAAVAKASETRKSVEWKRGSDKASYGGGTFPLPVENEAEAGVKNHE